MEITYSGGPRGLAVIKSMLEDEGLTLDYEPPIERRGAGEIIAFTVVINIGSACAKDALDAAITLAGDSALAGYHLFPSVRGDLLMKMGRLSEAREEIQRAIAMTKNLREQELLANRLKQLEKAASSV